MAKGEGLLERLRHIRIVAWGLSIVHSAFTTPWSLVSGAILALGTGFWGALRHWDGLVVALATLFVFSVAVWGTIGVLRFLEMRKNRKSTVLQIDFQTQARVIVPLGPLANDTDPIVIHFVNASITNISRTRRVTLEMLLTAQLDGKAIAANKAGDHLPPPFNLPKTAQGFPKYISSPLALSPEESRDGTIPFVIFPPNGRTKFFNLDREHKISWRLSVKDRISGAERTFPADTFVSYRAPHVER